MDKVDLDFLELHIENYNSLINGGYVRNLEQEILKGYESIYRKYLNKTYVMCMYCKEDVLGCIRRLYEFYQLNKII
jgi:hypothetical protein